MEEDYNGEMGQSGLDQQSATNVKNHVGLVKVTAQNGERYMKEMFYFRFQDDNSIT